MVGVPSGVDYLLTIGRFFLLLSQVVHKARLLLNCGGIFDVITFDPSSSGSGPMSSAMAHYQQEDLISLGKIVLGKGTGGFQT